MRMRASRRLMMMMGRAKTHKSIAAPSEGDSITAGADLTVTLDVDSLPSNLLLNPGFETLGANPPVFDGWSESLAGGSIVDETVNVNSGAHAVKVVSIASDATFIVQNVGLSKNIVIFSMMSHSGGTPVGRCLVRSTPSFELIDNTFVSSGSSYERGSGGPKTISESETGCEVRLQSNFEASETFFDDVALSEPVVIDLRRSDDDNKWHVVVDSNGRPVLYERIAGTDTARISGSDGDVTAGDTITVTAYGDDYELLVGSTSIGTYSGSSPQSDAKIVYMRQVGTGASVSDLTADWG